MKLDGKQLDASAAPGTYLTLTRVWKVGDRLEMDVPMHLYAEAMPDEPRTQAFLYGPLVLAGDLGTDGLTEAHIVGPNLRVGAAGVEQHGRLSDRSTKPLRCRTSRFQRFEPPDPT